MGARIAPLTDDQLDEGQRELLAASGAGTAVNIFRTFVRHPKLFRRWSAFGGQLLFRSAFDGRTRELAILRTAWRCRAPYEWGQHVRIGLEAGVTRDEVERLARPDLDDWDAADALLLTAVDELVADHRIGDDTWSRLAGSWDEKQLIELPFLVGHYVMVAMALNSAGVEGEAGVEGFPEA